MSGAKASIDTGGIMVWIKVTLGRARGSGLTSGFEVRVRVRVQLMLVAGADVFYIFTVWNNIPYCR